MAQYVLQGKVAVREKLTGGIENAGKALVDLMAGGHMGKAVTKVAATFIG